jgi:hypothetical protein
MLAGKVVGSEGAEGGRRVLLHIEVECDGSPPPPFGSRVLVVGEDGFDTRSVLAERGSQYLLVPSSMRTAGVASVGAKKVDLRRPKRTYFVFRCERPRS